MLITALTAALRDLTLPGILRLFLLCLLAYAIGWMALAWGVAELFTLYIGIRGEEGWLIHLLSSAGGGLIAWFLFPLLYPILVSFFDDHMADIIERADYPQLTPATPPFWPTFGNDVWFSLKALALNVLCLPLYFIPLIGAAVYYVLNGYLLGVQFFRMSAGRRVSGPAADALRYKARGAILLAGVLISFCATIPLLNLVAPLLGVATMLHLFHALNGTKKIEIQEVGIHG